ncbi:MAG: hypothetical protein JWL86_4270 [Rhizobium sp.]|nr:hypothetical protein [Rhizobium sp.]
MAVTHNGNYWYGDDENNDIKGNNQNEVMFAYAGNDTLRGMGGNDVLQGGLGNDDIDGGDGNDTLIDLGDTFGGTGNQLVGKDKLRGGDGKDKLVFQSSDGGDIGDGGDGTDLVEIDYRYVNFLGQTNLNFTLVKTGSAVLHNTAKAAFIQNCEQLTFYANSGDDAITGGKLGDKLYGFGGNDTLKGLGGNDLIDGGSGIQNSDGGDGFDTASFDVSASGESLTIEIVKTLSLGAFGTVKNFEAFAEVWTGSGSDTVINSDKGGEFHTGGGDDTFTGGKGNDSWEMGGGTDTGNMGDGDDEAFVLGSDNFNTGVKILHGGQGNDYLYSAAGADLLFGEDGDDRLLGGKGNDQLEGGEGNDELEGGAGADTLNGGNGDDYLEADADKTGFQTVLTVDSDVLNGCDGDDGFTGGIGLDTINGGNGDDRVELRVGNDTTLDLQVDVVDGGNDIDTLFLSIFYNLDWEFDITISDSIEVLVDGQVTAIAVNFEQLRVSGTGTGNQKLTGGNLEDSVSTSSGNDIVNLLGGDDYAFTYTGSDTVDGGEGDDQIHVDLGGKDDIDTGGGDDLLALRMYVLEETDADAVYDLGSGTDTLSINAFANNITFDGVHILLDGAQIGTVTGAEKLLFYGNATGNQDFDGTQFDDELYFGAGNDTISGGDGDDLISGGAGSDVINGDAGNNTAVYSERFNVGIEVTLVQGQTVNVKVNNVQEDTLTNIQNIIGGGGSDTITGDIGANRLFGYFGDDMISGGDGDDTIRGDFGIDTLTGGSGDDDFIFLALSDFGSLGAKHETIKDFVHNADTLDFSDIDLNGATAGDPAFLFLAKEGAKFTGKAGQIRFDQHGGMTTVEIDANGDKKADYILDLTGKINLDKGDFAL